MKKLKPVRHFASFFLVLLFLIFAFGSGDSESSTVNLNASVRFDGTQFIIKNNDNFDYENAKLEVNGSYSLRGQTLRAGETYSVGMMQFANKDGNRFTFAQKPQKFSIYCDINDGKKGFLYAEWN